ncbi:phosphatidylinositol 4-phosphate 5-kinase 8-like [Cucumis melo var. makuwa]|nr:phosphatidylinositol 4-phosphate 5-kinase 8-like [Cucumis melo var. makuwa]
MAVSKLFPEFYEGFSMTQSTSLLSRFPSFMSSPSSFSFPFATKSLAFQIFRHFRCRELLRVHSRLLIILSLPFIYFFLSNPRRSVVLKLFVLLFFSIAVLVFLNLAVPRLPSPIRLFLVRSSPISAFSSSAAKKAVSNVRWSIGSKPKSEKRLMSGSWVRVYSNGDVYEGEFHKGRCSGSGVYHYHMSGRYEGDWIDEKYDGYGVETWAKGSRYRGQYRQGLRNGIGIYRFYTGDVYAGEWSNGQCHGCGVHTCQDGSRYVGEFKWGVKHGLGHYHFRNGDTYAGEYFADKMHGFGVYRFGNGHRYEGAWHEGNRQGLGVYTFRNGETQSGHWQNGVLDVPSLEISHPGSSYAVSHAKVLAAVQEARRAAEKAFNAGRVDERVNKAVAAANKAANAARVAAVKAVQKQMDQETSTNPPILLV